MEDKNQTNTTPAVAAGSVPPTESVEPVTTNIPEPVVVPEPVPAPVISVTPEATATETPVIVTSVPAEIAPTVVPHPNALIKQYAIAFGVVLVMGGGLLYALEQQGRIDTQVFATVTQLINPAPAAAVVNGVKIPMEDYEKNIFQLEQAAVQGGSDPKNESIQTQIKKQAIDVLVNTELLRQAAAGSNITVSQEQIDARYAEIVEGLQGEDKLQARLAELGMTKEKLLSDIAGELLIQAHLMKAVDVTGVVIEDAEMQVVYDQANANPESPLPPFEQVKSAIENQLRTSKEQELVNTYIETLRTAATIETNV